MQKKVSGMQPILILILLLNFIGTGQVYSLANRHIPETEAVNLPHPQELIVLIHGLMRSHRSMSSLKAYLEQQGYQVDYYKYPSANYTIEAHGVYLEQFIKQAQKAHPGVTIHFITHSLGGIILREALGKFSREQLKSIGYLVMLAPPNQGSKLASFSSKVPLISTLIKPLAELSSDEHSYVHRVPVPDVKMGIIAGRYDIKVPPAATRLKGQPLPAVVNSTHMFIMSNAETKKLVTLFLAKGTFTQ